MGSHQGELTAEASWFHVFREIFAVNEEDTTEMAKMGTFAFSIYCAIKAHTHFNTGEAFPSISLLEKMTGFSRATVVKSIGILESMDYLKKVKSGRKNIYTLREKVVVRDQDGNSTSIATWDYIPKAVKYAQAELKQFCMTGDASSPVIIHIEQLNLQVNLAENNGLNVISAKDSESLNQVLEKVSSKDLQERIRAAKAAADKVNNEKSRRAQARAMGFD